ncbi:16S rRNA processing protein RimM [bacterium]|nr:16S rRNA processing protein RimM [bacterium]
MTGGEDFVVIGQVVRPHGLRGELKTRILTDFPERYIINNRYWIRTPGDGSGWRLLKQIRWQNAFVLLRFEDVDSLEAAEAFRNATIEIPRDCCHDLPEGEYYIADLIGLEAKTTDGKILGTLSDVIQQSAQDIYVINKGTKEILVPAVQEFIEKIDLEAGEILINPIEGLLD